MEVAETGRELGGGRAASSAGELGGRRAGGELGGRARLAAGGRRARLAAAGVGNESGERNREETKRKGVSVKFPSSAPRSVAPS
jgi:hypothetical protein